MAENITAFQQGREAAMCGGARDARRSAGWLEGYDMEAEEIARQRWAKKNICLATTTVVRNDHSGWRPIETAPKDGSVVLLYVPRGAGPIIVGGKNTTGQQWWARNVGDLKPTHWMPLPAPPERS